MRNGFEAFDELVRAGMMTVNEVEWGTIDTRPRRWSKRDLGFLIRAVSLMTAFDNQIDRSRSGEPDNLCWRKRHQG